MIKFSYHAECVGKPEKKFADGKMSLWVGDKRINLGYNWVTAELEFEDIFDMLSQHGFAFAPALSSDHRIEDTFVSHELALVDIDNGMTLAELQEFPFYQLYGSGYYTTPSHTDDAPRFRILYRLPTAITDPYVMRIIYEGLLAIHGAADISCKDSVRLFYGSVDALHRERTDRSIDATGLEVIIKMRDIALAERAEQQPTIQQDLREFEPKSEEQIAELLDELRKHYPDLNYATRRDVTWAVASAVSNTTTVALMRQRWPDGNKNGKYEVLVNGRKRQALTLGTIYHMIRRHDPLFAKHITADNLNDVHYKLHTDMNKTQELIKKWLPQT
jgi:hypothetical protein